MLDIKEGRVDGDEFGLGLELVLEVLLGLVWEVWVRLDEA